MVIGYPGLCAREAIRAELAMREWGDCARDETGGWRLKVKRGRGNSTSDDEGELAQACAERCRRCRRCAFASVSAQLGVCTWWHACNVTELRTEGLGASFYTLPKHALGLLLPVA